MDKKNKTIPNDQLTPTLKLFSPSYKLAIKAYEQIALLYLLPTLVYILGFVLIGKVSFTHFHLNTRQIVGVYLLLLWLVIVIINFPATMYLRVKAVKSNELPSVKECYQQGFKIMRKVYLTQTVTYLLICFGLILLVVPGIIMIKRYVLAPFYAIEHNELNLKGILSKAKTQTSPFMGYIFSTIFFLLFYQLAVSLIFGGNVISSILAVLLNYAVMFFMPLRYKEITTGNL